MCKGVGSSMGHEQLTNEHTPKEVWFSLPQYQSTANSSSVKSGVSWASPLKPGLVLCIPHAGKFSSCEFVSPRYIQKITFCNVLSPSSGLNFLLFSLLRYSLSPGMYLPARISFLQNVLEAYKSRLAHWFITHDKHVHICMCVCAHTHVHAYMGSSSMTAVYIVISRKQKRKLGCLSEKKTNDT